MTRTDSTTCEAANSSASTALFSTTTRSSFDSSTRQGFQDSGKKKWGRAISPPPFCCAAQTTSRPALEHDADGNRHELDRAVGRRVAVVTRFDERLEHRQRQVDTSAGVPAEVVIGRGGSTSRGDGLHVQSSAADQVRRNADARQTPHDVASRAGDAHLGGNTGLLTKLVVRAIDAQANRDEGKVDTHCNGTVVTQVRGILQVAHGLGRAASNSELERLHEAELRIRYARGGNECDRGDREEQ